MTMRTPLSQVTGLGSAKDGTSHFWYQRLTAIANVPLTLFLVWLVVNLQGADQAAIAAMFANPIVLGMMALMIISVTWHMRLGMQVVLEDYVHGEGAKIALIIANNFFSFGVAVLCIIYVVKLGFGG